MASFLKHFAVLAAFWAACAATAGAEVKLEALAPQRLEVGQCGLFLWSRSADQSFVMVAYDQPATARLRLDGKDRQLSRTSFAGEPVQGHFETQSFTEGRLSVAIDIEFDPDKPIRDGAILRRGLLRIAEAGGAETVVPVGGMVACKRS